MNMLETIEMFSGGLTPVIAIAVAYIAYQQHKTNKLKLKLDLFNKRFAIYRDVLKIVDIAMGTGKADPTDVQLLYDSVTEADFLFGSEIREYINKLCEHSGQLWAMQEEHRDSNQLAREGYNHGKADYHRKVAGTIKKEKKWFLQQQSNSYRLVRDKFDKYLNMNSGESNLCFLRKIRVCFRC